ncbi:uncharacterized protein T551_01991 [Pneumocystis jirovecii RU7]|uniref:Uncharacterized protein n=1 Tax=Pneumocystis jirovecii (strain RU7) TaxID=1408657 RepID=A0A0W4ZNV5_PNEJ7|nr:uncharacterized protein T551_01991 [Pneumocystis jirovecii RU7]KTW30047.1 hypothetical protein T551_01991 [Pneumocystis jirovecii RU7]
MLPSKALKGFLYSFFDALVLFVFFQIPPGKSLEASRRTAVCAFSSASKSRPMQKMSSSLRESAIRASEHRFDDEESTTGNRKTGK